MNVYEYIRMCKKKKILKIEQRVVNVTISWRWVVRAELEIPGFR